MLTIQYAKNPHYTGEEQTTIVVTVKFYEFEDEFLYGANSWDTEPHGIEIYTKALAGDFGPIAPYIPPTANTPSANT